MFKITPVQDINTAKEHLAICGTKCIEGCFVYAMTDCDTGNLMGISQFELSDGYGYIYDLKEVPGLNDFEAMFILGRQTMNFIDSCGIEICRAALDSGEEQLIKSIGLKKQTDY